MEVKLFIRTHKKGYGSVFYFTDSVDKGTKNIIEGIKYSEYREGMNFINEVSKEERYIYFITFVGGKDEFGREYRDVIASVFDFKLKTKDLLKLRKLFEDLAIEMKRGNFTLKEKYLLAIKGETYKASLNMRSSRYTLPLKYVGLVLISLLLTLTANKTYKGFKAKAYQPYIEFQNELRKETSNFKKYEMYTSFVKKETVNAGKYLLLAENEIYSKILNLYAKNKEEEENEILRMIRIYLSMKNFESHRTEIVKLKKELMEKIYKEHYRKIMFLVKKYNRDKNYNSLENILEKTKLALKDKDNNYRTNLEKIKESSEKIKKGLNINIGVIIVEKSAVFNRKSFEISIKNTHKSFMKNRKFGNDKKINVGNFYSNIKLQGKMDLKIYLYNFNGKKELVHSSEIKFEDLNKVHKIKDKRGNFFKIKLQISEKKFSI